MLFGGFYAKKIPTPQNKHLPFNVGSMGAKCWDYNNQCIPISSNSRKIFSTFSSKASMFWATACIFGFLSAAKCCGVFSFAKISCLFFASLFWPFGHRQNGESCKPCWTTCLLQQPAFSVHIKDLLQTFLKSSMLVLLLANNTDKEERRMSTTMDQIHHIIDLFYVQGKNISEIASETGFNWKENRSEKEINLLKNW